MNLLVVLLAGCNPQDATLSNATYHVWLAKGSSGTVAEGKLDLSGASVLDATTDTGIDDVEGSETPAAWDDGSPAYFSWLDDDVYYVMQGALEPWRSEALITTEGDFQLTVHHDLGDGQDFRFTFVIDPLYQPIVCIQENQSCYTAEDSDGDGLVDYEDPDCLIGGWEVGFTDVECNDGVDNDGDGAIDLDDADCENAWDNAEVTDDPSCADGADNDGDGYTDGGDPDCLNFGAEDPGGTHWLVDSECNDGLDNDGDGATDADDEQCYNALDNDEDGFTSYSACGDSVDNDGDGWLDGDDPDCSELGDEVGLSTAACSDGLDNDGDGDIDSADSGCYYTIKGTAYAAGQRRSELDLADGSCGDGKDNDGDGWADFDDPDCLWGDGENGAVTTECSDGVDNDGDGTSDADDASCFYALDSAEDGVTGLNCEDGEDNDGDGWTDDADPDCDAYGEEIGYTLSACNDGINNDADPFTDADDADCASASDNDEDGDAPSCSNGSDDDGDGWVDHDDPDCALGEEPGGEDGAVTTECSDGADNDGDGLTDADDPECVNGLDNLESSTWSCEDGLDNDGDGYADGADPECIEIGYERGFGISACNDGADNDGDGTADADDPDCFGSTSDSEEDAASCSDGADNDSDGWVDADDPDCTSGYEESGTEAAYECNDGSDNDGDGLTDADDDDCDYAWDNIEATEDGGDPVGFPMDYGVVLNEWSADEENHTIYYLNAGSYQLNPSNTSDFWVLPQEWLAGYAHAKFAAEEFDVSPTEYLFVGAEAENPDAEGYDATVASYDEEIAGWSTELETYGLMNEGLMEYRVEGNEWRPVDLSEAGLDNWVEANFSWVRINDNSEIAVGGAATGDFQIYLVGRESGSNMVIRGSFDINNIREDNWGYPVLEDELIEQNETPVCLYEEGATPYSQ